ncbi:hypothetical protein J7K93_09495 [bacterium]|nr:hypothetical protein [bacterium]
MRKNTVKILLSLSLLTGTCLILSCDVRSPVADNDFNPVIEKLFVPEKSYTESQNTLMVRAQVNDPQGINNIKDVNYNLFRINSNEEIDRGTLKDDGKNGDVIAGDGTYYCFLDAGLLRGNEGKYIISVEAIDDENNKSASAADTLNILSGQENISPVILKIYVPAAVTDSQADSLLLRAKISDKQGIADVCSLFCKLYFPLGNEPLAAFLLNNDGLSGDSLASDSIFSVKADIKKYAAGPGIYKVRFQAKDRGGLLSWPATGSFYLQIENNPPVLSNLSAPDTVSRSNSGPFTLKIQVEDPQGYGDISKVWFTVNKPDGSSTGTIFKMSDNGEDGDQQAQDGIFSLTISISAQNETGDYEFIFRAEDKSGLQSEPVIHKIIVVE